MCMYVRMYVRMHVRMYVCMYVFLDIHSSAQYEQTCIHEHAYIDTHTQTDIQPTPPMANAPRQNLHPIPI